MEWQHRRDEVQFEEDDDVVHVDRHLVRLENQIEILKNQKDKILPSKIIGRVIFCTEKSKRKTGS